MNERMIFDAALEIADPQARRAFIEKSCAGKPGMLAAVEALLKSHDAAGSFLNVPVAEQMRPDPASGIDSAGSSKPSEVFDKTRMFQSGTPGDDDSDDESQPNLSFLQPSSKPGSIGLLGHYEVLQVLGQGGFGIVLKAFDEKLHRLVAVKVMNAQMAATSPPRKRFLREARAAAAIRHENVVQVYSVEEQPLPYLVMEYIDGQTLQQKQQDHGPLEVAELLHIGRQIASGLAAAQAMGLIHRDIKPGNILIEQGAEQKVKITDFGLARAADDASLTRSGTISGTPMYMAPEQVLGQALDHRADLFSLGSVLYELASGRPPFRAANTIAVLRRVADDTPRPMQEIIPEIPDWLVAIVTKLHAKNPDDRFQSAKEVADLLARCQSELQLTGKVTCVNEVSVGREVPDDVRRGSPDPAETLDRRSPLRNESQAQGDLQFRTGEVRSANATPTPAQPKRRFRVSHFLIAGLAGLMVILAGTQLGRIVNPYAQKWLWPPIPKLAVTEVATGLRFDGKDDFVKVGPIDLSSPQYTLEAFVTSASDGDNGVIALLKNVEQEPELMYLYDGYPGKERKSGAGIVGQRPYQTVNAPLPSGIREHRALVVDGQVMHYFVNGIWQGKRYCTARKGLMWEMRELHLGCMANQTQFFRGQIDQLRLSKIARYNNNFTVASKLTSDDSTLALYNFDEAHGDVLNDSSGHGHHGKIVGATWASPNSSSSSLSPVESTDSTNPDRRAAEWVLSIGGTIKIKENGEERAINAGRDLPDAAFELTMVSLSNNPKVSDSGLAHFKGCKNVTELDLGGTETQVTDAGLAHFKECKKLTSLMIYAQVSDVGLAHFKDCKNLRGLALRSKQVSDAGLAHFQDCKNLTSLGLQDVPVTDAGLSYFKDCKNLTGLSLITSKVSDAGLAHFRDCKNLAELSLDDTEVTNAGLAHFKDCKNLSVLGLSATQVSDAGLAQLRDYKNLRNLRLSVTQVSDAGLIHFEDCNKLTTLSLAVTQVGDLGLERLAGFPMLTFADLKKTKVTEAGVKKLSAALPGCKIEWDGGVIEPSVSPDRRAAEYVLSIGGRININDNGQGRKLGAVGELPQGAFEFTDVFLVGNQMVSDAGLAHFQDCKNLRYLNLGGTQAGDAGVAYFKDCKDLTFLSLHRTKATDTGLAHFKYCKKLVDLSLGGTQVSDAGLAHFKDCKNLTQLSLQDTLLSDAGLANFQDCTKLTRLLLDRTRVSDTGLAHFKNCKNLAILSLNRTGVSDAGLTHFQDCKNLEYVDLSGTQVSDAGLAHFQSCKDLLHFVLQNTNVSNAGLERLAQMSQLSSVNVKQTKVTEAGVKKLSAALPGCKIEWDGGTIEPTVATNPDRRAAEWLLSIGGEFHYRENGELRLIQSANRLPEARFRIESIGLADNQRLVDGDLERIAGLSELGQLYLINTAITDDGLEHLRKLPKLWQLFLAGTRVTNAGLPKLREVPLLQVLTLSSTKITDEGLEHLLEYRALTVVDLAHTAITDVGLKALAQSKQLTGLVVGGTKITDSGLKEIAALKQLTALELYATSITDAGLDSVKQLPNLNYLRLDGTGITDDGLSKLREMKSLISLDVRSLEVRENKVTADGVKKLAAALPQCKIYSDHGTFEPTALTNPDRRAAEWVLSVGGTISIKENDKERRIEAVGDLPQGAFELVVVFLASNKKVTDAELAIFKNCKNLRILHLNGSKVSDAGLAHFQDSKDLSWLHLTHTLVSDAGLAHFKDCSKLTVLALDNTLVSDAGLVHVKGHKTLTHISLRKTKMTPAGIDELKQTLPHCKIEWDGGVIEPMASTDSDRRVAEWLISRKAHGIGINVPTGFVSLKANEALPAETTTLIAANLFQDQTLTPEDFKRFTKLSLFSTLILNETNTSDAHLAQLGELPELTKVYLYQTKITDAGVKHLLNYPKLELLHLTHTAITDAATETLRSLRNLKELHLTGAKVTEAGVKKLSAALPGCKIEWDGGVIEPKISGN